LVINFILTLFQKVVNKTPLPPRNTAILEATLLLLKAKLKNFKKNHQKANLFPTSRPFWTTIIISKKT